MTRSDKLNNFLTNCSGLAGPARDDRPVTDADIDKFLGKSASPKPTRKIIQSRHLMYGKHVVWLDLMVVPETIIDLKEFMALISEHMRSPVRIVELLEGETDL